MNDLDKILSVFDSIGIKYEVRVNSIEDSVGYKQRVYCDKIIEIDNGVGYTSFIAEFYFLDGKFQGHGLWE